MMDQLLEIREEPLPPAASPWILTAAAVVLGASAMLHLFLVRLGVTWSDPVRLGLAAVQALLAGGVLMQIGWRRPFALFLWALFVVFLVAFLAVVGQAHAFHLGSPIWAR